MWDDAPDDGVSYSTESPEWLRREARRIRVRRWIERALTAIEIIAWAVAIGLLLALIF